MHSHSPNAMNPRAMNPPDQHYLTHLTIEGDTWDRLAHHYYGNAYRYPAIIAANPHVPITGQLPAGLTLAIPLLPPEIRSEDAPPWMR